MRQRDPIPAKLFTATAQEVFRNPQVENKNINLDGKRLSDLSFADDVALTTETIEDKEHQLNTMEEESVKVGLKTTLRFVDWLVV